MGQTEAELHIEGRTRGGNMIRDDTMIVFNKKMLLVFMFEAMWRVINGG